MTVQIFCDVYCEHLPARTVVTVWKGRTDSFGGALENISDILLFELRECSFAKILSVIPFRTETNTKFTLPWILRQPYFWCMNIKVKVKQFHYSPGQALSVPAGGGSQISRQSAHEGDKVVSHTYRPPLPTRKYSWYSFLLEAEFKLRSILHPFRKQKCKFCTCVFSTMW